MFCRGAESSSFQFLLVMAATHVAQDSVEKCALISRSSNYEFSCCFDTADAQLSFSQFNSDLVPESGRNDPICGTNNGADEADP